MSALLVDDVVPFTDWPAAARASVAFLHRTVGLDVWMVTAVEEPRQVVLYSSPEEVLPPGTSILWERSFCHTMVSGVGPRVTTVAAATPAYRDHETGLPHRVAAYMGVPLLSRGGAVLGTLCGVSSRAQPRSLIRSLPLVEMTARLLSTLRAAETQAQPVASSSSTEIRERAM